MKILFQGDSITDGGRGKGEHVDCNHYMGQDYAYMVGAKLGLHYPEKHLEFANRGISGDRIQCLVDRWQKDTLDLQPDVCSILVGVNDCWGVIDHKEGDIGTPFGDKMRGLLDAMLLRNPDIQIVLMEPFVLNTGNISVNAQKWMEAIASVQEQTKKVAAEYETVFVPLQQMFHDLEKKRESSYWLWDGVHPSIAGHQAIADQWIACVKPELW